MVTGNVLRRFEDFERRPRVPPWFTRIRIRKPEVFPKVTIAIGLLCSDAIVVASDSQTTRDSTKSLHARKLSIINLTDSQILIAEAGRADYSAMAIGEMKKLAAGQRAESAADILLIAEKAVRSVFNHFWELYHFSERPNDEASNFFNDPYNNFSLILAFYFEKRPHLYSLSLNNCKPIDSTRHYVAIGIGRDIGEYLMDEHIKSKMRFEDGYEQYLLESIAKRAFCAA